MVASFFCRYGFCSNSNTLKLSDRLLNLSIVNVTVGNLS